MTSDRRQLALESINKNRNPAKPSSDTARSVFVLQDLVLELCEAFLAPGDLPPQERARLRSLAEIVVSSRNPHQWVASAPMDIDPEDPGHG